jgi:tRNA(Ile)-lysidine synthase
LERDFTQALDQLAPLPRGPMLVAVSGGLDSMCLLHLSARRAQARGERLVVGHVDHAARAGSEGDATFVAEQARALGLECRVTRLPPGQDGASEEALRDARYARLEALRLDLGAAVILLGHTRDDQLETVLFRALRGSGPRGLTGIPARRGALVRPLLERRREELEAWARAQEIQWREDPSNQSARYTRNRIRAELLPLMRDVVPGADEGLLRLAALAAQERRPIADAAAALWEDARVSTGEGGERVDLGRVAAPLRPLLAETLDRELAALTGEWRTLGARHREAFRELVSSEGGRRELWLPGSVRAARDRLALTLTVEPRRHTTKAPPGDSSGLKSSDEPL